MTHQIDLAQLTGDGEVTVISGRDRGQVAREDLGIKQLDQSQEGVVVHLPDYVRAITPSFILGMFGPSVVQCGSIVAFFEKYHFEGKPHLKEQIRRGVQFSLLKGNALEPA